MASPIIPMRPRKGMYDLTPEEMSCLNWHILSGCPRDEAFLRFIRPDYIMSKNLPAVKEAVKQFFSSAVVRDYMDAYRDTVLDASKPKEKPAGSMEERKARAKGKLVEFAMDLANNIDSASDVEFVMKIADKAGLLDQEESAVEQPRRYLPVSCGSCEYRKFVEENCDRVEEDTSNNT